MLFPHCEIAQSKFTFTAGAVEKCTSTPEETVVSAWTLPCRFVATITATHHKHAAMQHVPSKCKCFNCRQ